MAGTRRVWVVRAGRAGEAEELNLREGIVSIGWAALADTSHLASREELAAAVEAAYPGESVYRIGNWVGQIWRFQQEMAHDDLVLMPRKGREEIEVGTVSGGFAYRPDLPGAARKTRSVLWQGSVRRDQLGSDLRNSIGSLLTVFEVSQPQAAERLLAVLEGGTDPLAGDGADAAFSSKARVNEMLRAACVVLRDAVGPLPVKHVIAAVKEMVPPTETELTTNASGSERYDTNLRWWSVDLVKAEWIVKAQGRWELTQAGRTALDDFPDPQDFGREANRLYQVWKSHFEQEKKDRQRWELSDALVSRIPTGRWTTFTDVASLSGVDAAHLGRRLWDAQPSGWHRVLRVGGTMSAEAYGNPRAEEQRELLAQEGLLLEPAAPEEAYLSGEALRELLDSADVDVVRRAWLVRGSSVRGKDLVPDWLEQGFVSLPASQLGRLTLPATPETVTAAVGTGYSTLSYAKREQKSRELRSFLLTMRPGDLVVTTSDGQLMIGEVDGDAEFLDSPDSRSNLRRPVAWLNADSPADYGDLSPLLKSRLRASGDLAELTDLLEDIVILSEPSLDDETDVEVVVPVPPARLRVLTQEEADTLLMPKAWLDEMVDLLEEKRQVILYGPPGTGKTYLAQRVAELAANPDHVTLVQFHPAYSYEDFFEGYRPVPGANGQVGFELKAGPFRRVVDDAREHPDQAYVIVVDEINRANLAKVFGELYFLLEYRDAAIELLYSERDSPPFTLPRNVYLIGTMNTADRSIALVDAAMRRRFAFLSLHPDDDHVSGVLRAWLTGRDRDDRPARLLAELNRRIPDGDFKVGPSYLMNDGSQTEAGLSRIWRTSILPLLEEFHVGDGVDVPARYGLAVLLAAVAPEPTSDAE